MFGFLPLGLPATCFHQAGLGRLIGIGRDRLAAAGAIPECCGPFFARNQRLAFQANFEDLLGEDFLNLNDQVFEFGELGTPLGTFGSPKAVGKVFGDALEVSTNCFYLLTPLSAACHPWLLLEVKASIQMSLPWSLPNPSAALQTMYCTPLAVVRPHADSARYVGPIFWPLAGLPAVSCRRNWRNAFRRPGAFFDRQPSGPRPSDTPGWTTPQRSLQFPSTAADGFDVRAGNRRQS